MYTVMRGIFEDKNNQEKLFLENNAIGNDLFSIYLKHK
jgi:hypothetical protein